MKRSGITLVEMLVAMAITLLLMATVVQVFSVLGTAVADSRGALEMADRLRQARNLLQADLGSISRPVVSWVEDDSGGYFEYVEGQGKDTTPTYLNPTSTVDPDKSRFGDFDDVLMFTATSNDRPFQGLAGGTMIESPNAEIIWACQQKIVNDVVTRTVYRRVLLVAPWAQSLVSTAGLSLAEFQQQNDLSAHWDGSKVVLNSMADLRLRQNRYRHQSAPFPHVFQGYVPLTGNRQGEDMVLPGALAFDVRIYDPGAPLYRDSGNSVVYGPCDPGYSSGTLTGHGAYVDLGYGLPSGYSSSIKSQFDGPVASRSQLTVHTYDTWPADYESDGVDQDGAYGADQGTNGFDDNDLSGVDGDNSGEDQNNNGMLDPGEDINGNGRLDSGERETAAPYAASPTGIQVKLRVYEPDSRQIREMTVNQHFAR